MTTRKYIATVIVVLTSPEGVVLGTDTDTAIIEAELKEGETPEGVDEYMEEELNSMAGCAKAKIEDCFH